MRKNLLFLITCTVLAQLAVAADEKPASVLEEKKIHWLVTNVPMYYIAKEPWKESGPSKIIINHISKSLPEYSHTTIKVTSAEKVFQSFESSENTCIPALFKFPEIEKHRYYSTFPSTFSPAPRVIILSKNEKRFGVLEKVNLAQLLKREQFKLGLHETRRYNGKVDTLLKDYKRHPLTTLYLASQKHAFFDIYRGLIDGHIDYMIAPATESHFVEVNAFAKKYFTTYAIEEQENLSITYVNCTRNEWGRKLIERISPLLADKKFINEIKESYSYWMDPEEVKGYEQALSVAVPKYFDDI